MYLALDRWFEWRQQQAELDVEPDVRCADEHAAVYTRPLEANVVAIPAPGEAESLLEITRELLGNALRLLVR